jgi:predicted acyl esterase
VFVTVRKFRDGREVTFEGSYGFRGDAVTHGMLAASRRAVDPARSLPGRPFHPFTTEQPLAPGEVVAMDVELLPSATLFRTGDELRLEVTGRWPFTVNPLTGYFPAVHRALGRGGFVLHTGGGRDAVLTVPVGTGSMERTRPRPDPAPG